MAIHSRVRKAAVASMAVALIMGFTAPANAVIAIIKNERALFGPFSVARGEVVRVNVTALGGPDTMPTDVTVRFFDARGEVIKEQQLSVGPGTMAFVDFVVSPTSPLAAFAFGRRPTRAEVVGFNPQPDPPGFMATVEVMSALTRQTHVFIGDPGIAPELRIP